MLVLTRKPGERLVIGNNIVVTVVSVRNGQVRLGFEAPREVSIRREEIVTPTAEPGETKGTLASVN